MTNGDYFFLVFLGTVAVTRILVLMKVTGPTLKGFRIHHYMYGVLFIVLGFVFKNITLYAIGFGWFVDELPIILAEGPAYKNEHWTGPYDYGSKWYFVGVLILVFLIYLLRYMISGII